MVAELVRQEWEPILGDVTEGNKRKEDLEMIKQRRPHWPGVSTFQAHQWIPMVVEEEAALTTLRRRWRSARASGFGRQKLRDQEQGYRNELYQNWQLMSRDYRPKWSRKFHGPRMFTAS